MSSSTVSVTPNPASAAARRRPVEKKKSSGVDLISNNDAVLATAEPTNNLSQTIRTETTTYQAVHVKKPFPRRSAPEARRASTSGHKAESAENPKWLVFVRILTKYLLLLLVAMGLVSMVWKLASRSPVAIMTDDGVSVNFSDWEARFAGMEALVKKSTEMVQVQIDGIDRKVKKHVEDLRGEMEAKEGQINEKLKKIGKDLEKQFGENAKDLLTREEFEDFLLGYMKARDEGKTRGGGISLDEVRVYAKEIVEREIEKHAADGIGRVDYALAAGGGRVLKHSEPAVVPNWFWLTIPSVVHPDAEKMLTPSFGEPGQCFPLKGSSGFVTIRLRTAIVPEAVTLEHVAKSVAYDRSSAPKDCRISGWLEGQDSTAQHEKMFLLTEFSYDLDKSNAQTFNVLDSEGSRIVNTIRFDFTSNHGSLSHTCIYRLRIHGYEPTSIPMLQAQP